MNSRLGRLFGIVFVLGISVLRGQQYYATDLNSASFTPTMAYGVATPYQAGSGTINNQLQALFWNGSLSSVVNLTPTGYRSALALGIYGLSTVGQGTMSSGQTVALYWPVPVAASVVNLNPSIGSTPAALSVAYANSGNQQVGYAETSSGSYYAYLWSGSAASGINLQPTGTYVSSTALGTNGSQQVGFATIYSGYSHAMRWSGSAGSAIDLHPAAFMQSFAQGISAISSGSVAVGFAEPSIGFGESRAYAWSSTGAQSIHPAGFINSFAMGISGSTIVGFGTNATGQQVALLWQGISASPINLSAFLPAGATNAEARAIDSAGNISGYASVNAQNHAFLWQPGVAPSFTNSAQNVTTSVGILYNFKFQASGAPAPTFTLSSGSAPPGLSLSSAGTLSGTPTTTGTFTGTVTASNGILPSATQNFTITVTPTPVQSYAVLHSFFGVSLPKDGIQPSSGLLQGSDGNLYGMTPFGGTGANISGYAQTGSGTIFKISPEGIYSIVHNFCDGTVTNDGAMPCGALIQGTDGNFYGVTESGGLYGFGTVFKVTPQGVVTIMHSFYYGTAPHDGAGPAASLIQASDGNLYGTTMYGGSAANGTIFRMSLGGTYAILHNFNDGSVAGDGKQPAAALIQASDGNLYGTTDSGGSAGFGTLYQLSLPGTYSLVRSFADGTYTADPKYPSALVEGGDGNFYATAYGSTTTSSEIAFKMTLQGLPTILHVFGDGTLANDGASSGALPTAGLIQGSNGNFYGTTVWGGQPPMTGYGVAFQMTPTGTITILHVFADGTVFADGANPSAPLCQGIDGNLYGSTTNGGATGNGSLFQIALIGGSANPVAIETTPPGAATVGTNFSFSFTASGSPAPTFTVTAGSLPPGVTLSSAGALSGTPTQAGTYTATVTASNGAGTSATESVTLVVAESAADTPTMPPWALAVLAGLLAAVAFGSRRGISAARSL